MIFSAHNFAVYIQGRAAVGHNGNSLIRWTNLASAEVQLPKQSQILEMKIDMKNE